MGRSGTCGPARWSTAGVAVVAATAAAVAVCAVLDARADPARVDAVVDVAGWSTALTGLFMAVPGAVVLRASRAEHPQGHPVAWVLLLTGALWGLDGLAASWLVRATEPPGSLPGATAAFWVVARLGASLLLGLPLLLVLVPEGRLPTGRWRLAVLVSLASTALLPALVLVLPSGAADQPSLPGVDLDPLSLSLPVPLARTLLRTAQALVPVSLLVPFALVAARSRGPVGPVRTRSRWLLWSALVAVIVMLSDSVLPRDWSSAALTAAAAVVSASCAVALVRPDLLDVDRLLGGTVIWSLVVASVLVVDVALVAGASALLGRGVADRDAALTAVVVVTAVYGPLRERVWRVVRRALLGERDDPWHAVSSLARALERSDGAQQQLLAVAESVAHAFRVRDVAVEVERADGGRLVATCGSRPEPARELPLTYRGAPLGRLLLPAATGRSRLSARDERLLGDLVRQAALAARAEVLAEDLQRSRAAILGVREEDRRRVRRDLHDGLGPVLGAAVLGLDTVSNLDPGMPQPARAVLLQVRDDVRGAVAEVRRLAHDLRPPALDDLGLLGALRQHAERLRTPGGLLVAVEAADELDLRHLPAAVEVAAYRIAAEAVANAVRHSRASRCTVRLARREGGLVVEVDDDGRGIDPAAPAGVGLVSLRERTDELGGSASVVCPRGGGTRVRALLPLPPPGAAGAVGAGEAAAGGDSSVPAQVAHG